MSRLNLDRPRSNIGPAPVQYFACVSAYLSNRFRDSPKKAVPGLIADELGMSASAVRKWLFRQPQHLPGPEARRAIARVYGRDLAAVAGLPFEAWREAFLFGEIVSPSGPRAETRVAA